MEKICSKYPVYMTTGPIGEKLYKLWRDIRAQRLIPCVRTWAAYEKFFEWSMANGATLTNSLVRKNLDEPYGPDNCIWVEHTNQVSLSRDEDGLHQFEEKVWDDMCKWLRIYYGIEKGELYTWPYPMERSDV